MKIPHVFLVFTMIASFIVSLNSVVAKEKKETEPSKAVEALKQLEQRTGKTAGELLPAIEIYASMIELLAEDLENGAVKKEELAEELLEAKRPQLPNKTQK